MSTFPNVGEYVQNLRGISPRGNASLKDFKDYWVIVYNNPYHRTQRPLSLFRHHARFKDHQIALLSSRLQDSSPSLCIIDPDGKVQAKFYIPYNNHLTCDYLIDFVTGLRTTYRPQVHGISNQPINPACSDLKPIVGEYVLGNPINVDPYLSDFLIYAFALINPDGTLTPYSERYLRELVALRNANPTLKIVMAIGGWGADGFSDVSLTPASRYDFAREVKKWVDEYKLDGVDIDWEYPGNSVAGIKSRPEDKQNFTLLLQALRDVLGPNAWLSVAGTGDASYIRNVEINQIAPIINYFNVMSYDFTAGSSGLNAAKHQSNLYPSSLSLGNVSVDTYVQNLIDAGMPSEKILVGIPFYARFGSSVTKTFDEIRRLYLNKNGYTVKWDDEAKVPYIVDQFGNFAFALDNELSIFFKGQYVLENCLGGLFSWHSNFDSANILASAMNDAINDPDKLEEITKNFF